MSFPYPAAFQATPEKRNAARHEDVLRQVRGARAALQSMVDDLTELEGILTGNQWEQIAEQGYFRAEIVGRIFSQTHHRLRDYHDAEVIAVARAGGFEDEAPFEHRVVDSVSGEMTCSCRWTSGHFAHGDDASDAFDDHLRDVGQKPPLLMSRDDIEVLREAEEAGNLSYGQIAMIEGAFGQIDPAHFNEPAENAMAGDMLDEIENENARRNA